MQKKSAKSCSKNSMECENQKPFIEQLEIFNINGEALSHESEQIEFNPINLSPQLLSSSITLYFAINTTIHFVMIDIAFVTKNGC